MAAANLLPDHYLEHWFVGQVPLLEHGLREKQDVENFTQLLSS